jgi:hypothetical protein
MTIEAVNAALEQTKVNTDKLERTAKVLANSQQVALLTLCMLTPLPNDPHSLRAGILAMLSAMFEAGRIVGHQESLNQMMSGQSYHD